VKAKDLVAILALGALWGASFMFLRIATPEFGAFAVVELRVAIAALFLLPFFLAQGSTKALRRHWRPIALIGLLNTALPFCLLAYATLFLTGGVVGIFNATAPIWGALAAWLWNNDRPGMRRVSGMLLGTVGVLVLASGERHLGFDLVMPALAAALIAPLLYGISAIYIKKHLVNVDSIVMSTGSQITAALALIPFAVLTWPTTPVSSSAIVAIFFLGVACTGLSYLLYFRLIASAGPVKTLAVTYLIPAFAIFWGALIIDEPVTVWMLIGCAVILAGVALTTGAIRKRAP
jgi:drug/metabolite transporter (DMT)-like permease